jgi:hypothetical protein
MGHVDGAQQTEGLPCMVSAAKTFVEAEGPHETARWPDHLRQEIEEDLYENNESQGTSPPTLIA